MKLSTYSTAARAVVAHPAVRLIGRFVRGVVVACAIVLAVVVVTTLTVDLGPVGKTYAERYGSQYLERPLHIGHISFRLWTGRFLIEDLEIEGVTPESRPFLRAARIEVAVPWGTLLDRRVVLRSIEMTDWRMYLEVLPDGRHTLPRLTPRGGSERRGEWTTTLQWVRAHRGEFTYEDHGTPWTVVTRNLDVEVGKPGPEYRGRASFSNGVVAVEGFEPFSAEMTSSFRLDGGRVVFDRIDLVTDGARTRLTGDVNFRYFPEMMYRVESTIDFGRMRKIFFAREAFELSGTGTFSGFFHLFKEPRGDGTNRTGRELTGTFSSPRAGVNEYRFDDLLGTVRWTPDRLLVSDAAARIYGGLTRFSYEMAPLGATGRPTMARLATRFEEMSLTRLSEAFRLEGLRLAGEASGDVTLRWPLGRFAAARELEGAVAVRPPGGVELMTRAIPVERIEEGRLPRSLAAPLAPLMPLAVGADLLFAIGPGTVVFGPSHAATQRTYVEFSGETSSDGERAEIPFHVSSADWQESVRVFADVMTALGSPTGEFEVGGFGTFDGVLRESVRRPRIEGAFLTERLRAWDVDWGRVSGHAVIEDGYADVTDTTILPGDSRIETEGRFALGFRRGEGGDEIDARVRLVRHPVSELRHAFGLDRYPVDGRLSGELRLFGQYTRPFGYGTLELEAGEVYGEPFDRATANLGLEGDAARLTALVVEKGGITGNGAAYVTWSGSYSFDFSATALPIEAIRRLPPTPLPLSGLIDFTASGSGTFDAPRYTVKGTIRDLFAADEGIGQVDVREVTVIDDTLSVDATVASPRLAVDVLGRVDLTGGRYADVSFNVNQTSLDPYVRAFDPRLSPFTTAVVSGRVRVVGDLDDIEALQIDVRVDELDLRLFDYQLTTPAPFRVAFERRAVRISEMQLFGDDTKLEISGAVGLEDETLSMTARGDANLAILQGVVPNISSSGRAVLSAEVSGSLQNPVVGGTLGIENGRIRHFGVPHALERIGGSMTFDPGGVTLDGLTAEIGGGPVQFGGRIDREGLLPGRLAVTIAGQRMRVRYPQGMLSLVDATLTLDGRREDMRLGGEVIVRDALYSRPFPSNLFQFIGGDEDPAPRSEGASLPLTYDGIRIVAASSVRVQNTGDFSARLAASADLELQGTYDRPALLGDMEIDRGGVVTFLGKRYTITRGVVYFNNPVRIESTIDIEAEARVRVPGETYRITANVSGICCDRLDPVFSSDPALSQSDILALMFSDVAPEDDVELRQFRADNSAEQRALREFATQAATGAVSSQVFRALEEAFGVDRVQITPSFLDRNQASARLEPSVRLRLEERISDRVFMTYSRSLSSSSPDEIIQLEFDYTDQVTWVFSRNEDQTYAIEVRLRHAF